MTDPTIQGLITTLTGAAIIGLVTAVITLWREFTAHKLHVAEQYANKELLDEFKGDLKELRYVVWRIAERLEIPVARRD